MGKHIDAEWISNVYADFKDYEGRDDWTTPISNVLAVIDDAPSIDIVRCKECRYWKWIEWAKEYRCTLRNTAFNARADDFCSYGERRSDE